MAVGCFWTKQYLYVQIVSKCSTQYVTNLPPHPTHPPSFQVSQEKVSDFLNKDSNSPASWHKWRTYKRCPWVWLHCRVVRERVWTWWAAGRGQGRWQGALLLEVSHHQSRSQKTGWHFLENTERDANTAAGQWIRTSYPTSSSPWQHNHLCSHRDGFKHVSSFFITQNQSLEMCF